MWRPHCTGDARQPPPRRAVYNAGPGQSGLPQNPESDWRSLVTPADIEALIAAHLPGCAVQVASNDNVHFEAVVVSAAFAGKRPLQRHQLVYAAIGARMGGDIHALSIRALTPDEAAS